jgi:ElaB/YqjD/DUF883 family membrane-anchored ribosome-binding protein
MSDHDKEGLLGKAVHVTERVAQVGVEASRIKTRASHAFEDAVVEAKRLAKRGRYAAEDLVDDAAYRIKRDPLRSVAITFGAGFALGLVAGWLVGRGKR